MSNQQASPVDVDFTEGGTARPSTPQPTPVSDLAGELATELPAGPVEDRPPAYRPFARLPRPKAMTVVALIVAAVVFWFVMDQANRPSPSDPTDATTTSVPTPASASASVTAQVDAAMALKGSAGTFEGFVPTSPTRAATGRDTLVVSTLVGNTCAYGGFVDGAVTPVLVDPTGQACTDQAVAEAQAAITEADTQVAEADIGAASAALEAAVANAKLVAGMGISTGQGPFAGLQQMPMDGVSVVSVSPDGNTVTLQAPSPNGCLVVEVYADGTSTTPVEADCS
jgi:hypothetical protein